MPRGCKRRIVRPPSPPGVSVQRRHGRTHGSPQQSPEWRRYDSAEGVETHLVTASRGERGRFGSQDKTAEPSQVGRIREAELRAAGAVLGIHNVSILGYPDGAVDQMDAATAIRAITWHIRRIRPDVVVTFGPEGAYGHPDHIAISQFATAAAVCASDSGYLDGSSGDRFPSHRVAKLHYMAWPMTSGRLTSHPSAS